MTTYEETLPHPADEWTYAGFWRRLAAGIIDALIIGGAVFVVRFLVIIALIAGDAALETLTIVDILIGYVAIIVIYWLYFALQQSSALRATVGMRALGIVLVNKAGERISFTRATARYFATALSAIILMVGFLMIAFTPRKQGLHDILTDTVVVRARSV